MLYTFPYFLSFEENLFSRQQYVKEEQERTLQDSKVPLFSQDVE